MVDGSIWKISPDEQTAETMLHRARRHQMSAGMYLKRENEAMSWEKSHYNIYEQQRFRRACVSAQSRQNLCCSLMNALGQGNTSTKGVDLRTQ